MLARSPLQGSGGVCPVIPSGPCLSLDAYLIWQWRYLFRNSIRFLFGFGRIFDVMCAVLWVRGEGCDVSKFARSAPHFCLRYVPAVYSARSPM